MRIELYDEIAILYRNEQKKIVLVQHMIENLFFVKKVINTQRNLKLYEQLMKHPHTNLANVKEFSCIHDKTFVIEEFINGCTLEFKLSQRLLEMREFYSIMLQMFDVIEHLHKLNPPIIHRDIKPDNIIIIEKQIYLIDFEIAKCSTEVYDAKPMGSIGFAPPEQYLGFSDERTDIYALGILLEMLIDRTDWNQVYNHEFSQIILAATMSDPNLRYENIQEMRNAFHKVYKK